MAQAPEISDPSLDPRAAAAFPTLSDEHIAALEQFGDTVRIKKGDTVWEAGQVNVCMFVVKDGEMTIVDGRTHSYVATHTKGGFSGDIDVLSGRPTLVAAVAATHLEVLIVQGDCVRSIVAQSPELGELILRAFLMRRTMLREREDIGPLIMGSRYSPDTLRIREFLSRNRFPYEWEDLEQNPNTHTLLRDFHVTEDKTPIVVLPTGDILEVPSNDELAEKLGLKQTPESKTYDLIVVGAGPAGLAAGVYGASEGLSTLVIDDNGPGGQAGTSSRIENYMGFPLGLSGQDLADNAVAQAEKFGAQIMASSCANSLNCNDFGGHEVDIDGVGVVTTRCVILAPGASYRQLEAENMDKFEARGVYYSATNVERQLCNEMAVAVVGAGNSAGQAAVYLSDFAAHVFLVVRGDDLRKNMSSYLAVRIERSDKITVLLNSEITKLDGSDHLEQVTIMDRKTSESRIEEVGGVFVMIGAVPHTDWLPEKILCDSKGFIVTGQELAQRGRWKLSRPPFFLETSCPGVFAAGDARCGSIKRVASAVGEGSMAVAFVHQFLAL